MKYALVNGQRQEAQPGLSGVCPACDNPVFAKCGNIRIRHWSHHGRCDYEHWWENETKWHLAWKGLFPKYWHEHIGRAETGEKHIADVKTNQGWELEFQHSKIDPDERKAREAFYRKLIWIVDGARRKSDKSQFFMAWNDGNLVDKELEMRRISLLNKCALLRDWAHSRVPVFFDFSWCNESEDEQLSLIDSSGGNKLEDSQLWCLIRVIDGMAYIVPFLRAELLEYHSPKAMKLNPNFARHMNGLFTIASNIARPRQHGPSYQERLYREVRARESKRL